MPNKKNIEEVKRLSKSLSKAKAIYFTEYHGLNVGDLTKLRSQFFKADVEYKVAKNTLVKLAAKDNNIQVDEDLLKGSTALAISFDEPVVPAKIIKDFKKNNDLPEVKGIFFDGEFLLLRNGYFFSKSIISFLRLSYSASEIFCLFFSKYKKLCNVNSFILLLYFFFNELLFIIIND